jgi:hypothetical protein
VIAGDGSRDITPNALIEAMAMGLPAVSTRVTAIPEIVDHGVTGLLVPPADGHALAAAIETLAREPAMAHTMGEHARQRVGRLFDVKRNVSRYVELFSGGQPSAFLVGDERAPASTSALGREAVRHAAQIAVGTEGDGAKLAGAGCREAALSEVAAERGEWRGIPQVRQ